MRQRSLARSAIAASILWMITSALLAQGESGMMMNDGMMMGGGWSAIACVVFGVLLFILLILGILALWKYLFGTKS